MDRPHSVNRRQAWAQFSRHWITLEDTDLNTVTSSNKHTGPVTHLSLQNDLIMEGGLQSTNGRSTGKIETWLQTCGYEARPENLGQVTVESVLKSGNSFEDDLSLGAEATVLGNGLQEEFVHCPLLMPPPKSRKDFQTSNTSQQRINLPLRNMGHSMTSSVFSSITNKTASSVSEALQMCTEDAEETLYQLGFGCEEPQVTARIPARFFNFPSQLRGINFRLFLESQLRRIREEDPCLSLASRFRQVEVLTTMANAFYSLYSHVSRTPLQKLAPPEFSFSSPTVERSIGQRFFSPVRTEPRSPVERLKDTVSKMCLYTGSRGSDSASPSYSPQKRRSVPDVDEIVMGNSRTEDSHNLRKKSGLQQQVGDLNVIQKMEDEKIVHLSEVQNAERTCSYEKMSNEHKERILRWSQSSPKVKVSLFKSEHTSLDSVPNQKSNHNTDRDESPTSFLLHPETSKDTSATKTPVAILSHDALSPHVMEHVHKAPYTCPQTDNMASVRSPAVQMHNQYTLRTLELENKPFITDLQSQICPSPAEDSGILAEVSITSDISQDHPGITQCQIMVTGWQDNDSISHRNSFEDYISFIHSDSTDQLHTCPSDNQRYLNLTTPSDSQIKSCPKQANSFELEEVQSVGEEENASTVQCCACTLSVTASPNLKYITMREDSFQSDSSGYAEEDAQHSDPTTQRNIS